MRKNLLTLMLGFLFLFLGTFTVKAEVPIPVGSNVKMSKKLVRANATKLKKIEFLVGRVKLVCSQVGQSCLERLEQLELAADWAVFLCTYGTQGMCDSQVNYTLGLGDAWAAAGCDTGPPGTVIVKNTNRKIWMIRKVAIENS